MKIVSIVTHVRYQCECILTHLFKVISKLYIACSNIHKMCSYSQGEQKETRISTNFVEQPEKESCSVIYWSNFNLHIALHIRDRDANVSMPCLTVLSEHHRHGKYNFLSQHSNNSGKKVWDTHSHTQTKTIEINPFKVVISSWMDTSSSIQNVWRCITYAPFTCPPFRRTVLRYSIHSHEKEAEKELNVCNIKMFWAFVVVNVLECEFLLKRRRWL